jgi:hypothetical protein
MNVVVAGRISVDDESGGAGFVEGDDACDCPEPLVCAEAPTVAASTTAIAIATRFNISHTPPSLNDSTTGVRESPNR